MAKSKLREIVASPVISRIIQLSVALFGLSILIFVIARVLPGDPARVALGTRAPDWAVEKLREQLHLNEPIYVQYYFWLQSAFSGDLGQSLVTFRSVTSDILEFLPATVELIGFTVIVDIPIALALGVLAGRRANTWVDNAVRGVSYIGVSVPPFVFGIIFILIFGYYLNVLPAGGRVTYGIVMPPRVTGLVTIDALIAGRFDVFADALRHLILPGFSLALGTIAQEARIIRSGMVENLRKDYISAAISHGIPDRVVTYKYLLKPSMIPAVTIMALDIAGNIGQAFLVEIIYNWPGFSKYGTTAILRKDLNAIVAVVMVTGLIFATMTILIDIIVSYLDPRIRLIKVAE